MSEYHNFHSKDWAKNFLQLLYMDRKIQTTAPSDHNLEERRYSMEVSAEFKSFIDGKRKNAQEKKENIGIGGSNTNWQKSPKRVFEETNICDDSFEALEKMCDKTVSDPESTLYRYMNSGEKEAVLRELKERRSTKRSDQQDGNVSTDPEVSALRRLLDELHVNNAYIDLNDESPLKGVDITQVDDIDEPSKLWESVMMSDLVEKTSPVKMVGLMRPSTILENDDSNLDESPILSFTASDRSYKSVQDNDDRTKDVLSSCGTYLTANDESTRSVNLSDERHSSSSQEGVIAEETVFLINLNDTPIAASDNIKIAREEQTEDDDAVTIVENSSSDESENDSIIMVASDVENDDDDDDNKNFQATETDIETENNNNIRIQIRSYNGAPNVKTIIDNNPSRSSLPLTTNVKDEENEASDNDNTNLNTSETALNDTLEEVEYLMQKGLEFMRSAGQAPMSLISPAKSPQSNVSAVKKNVTPYSPQPAASSSSTGTLPKVVRSPAVKRTATTTTNTTPNKWKSPLIHRADNGRQQTFAQQMKPPAKFNLFAKPTGTAMRKTHSRHATSSKQFAHIASPIRVYVNNTGTTPLMTNIQNSASDETLLNATGFCELAEETRQLQLPNIRMPVNGGDNKLLKNQTPNKPCSLPKKAYISSHLKHVVDERTAVTIPGGPSIQKYLQSAILPAVVRHEGKMKYENKPPMKKTASMDLANLSLASGDVSIYRIQDAQHF